MVKFSEDESIPPNYVLHYTASSINSWCAAESRESHHKIFITLDKNSDEKAGCSKY